MSDNFQRAARHIGWGDPGPDSLWFVGIEETLPWKAEHFAVLSLNDEDGATFDLVNRNAHDQGAIRATRTRIPEWESKIASKISRSGVDWTEYRDKYLWHVGSKVFSTNLFPLGKRKTSYWPPHYKDLFGFGEEDWTAYLNAVRTFRYPALRRFRERHQPAAIVAFGKGYWPEFRKLFGLKDPIRQCMGETIELYDRDKVVLCPFFGFWHMNARTAESISAAMKNWGVSIP